jgi:hypothetical protein
MDRGDGGLPPLGAADFMSSSPSDVVTVAAPSLVLAEARMALSCSILVAKPGIYQLKRGQRGELALKKKAW